ncbi:MAG: hypothetical protein HWD59_12610 [Coxiellaceae bacterium]|nr:MAG: hypothetical protein HWD59_12610 [Coxiellaceae bacterium]
MSRKNDSIALSGKPEVAKNQLIELQQNLQQQLLENERQQEQLKAMIEKSQRIESNFNGTEALQQQLIQTFNQHQILWAKHSAVEARQRAVEAFKTRPNQWEFYHGLLIRLEEFVIGCKTAASKFLMLRNQGS